MQKGLRVKTSEGAILKNQILLSQIHNIGKINDWMAT